MTSRKSSPNRFIKICAGILCAYLILAVALFWLMGEQLHLRSSRGNMEMRPATAGTVELIAGTEVEQTFISNIQRLEEISVMWGGFYRPNTGDVLLELYDSISGILLLSQRFDATSIGEGSVTTMPASTPIEGLFGKNLTLKITSQNGVAGNAVTPLMAADTIENGQLSVNGMPVVGTLCFSASGTDYIWTGLHYWEFVVAGGAVLLGYLIYLIYCERHHKKNLILYAVAAIKKYGFLLRQLVSRDFKTKYKRSVLGVLWSFLNPLLMMAVQYLIFSTIFKNDIPHFPVYLLIGVVMFNFFSEASNMTMGAILGNASLITKVYVPKYIYPLSKTCSSVINLCISLLPLVAMILIVGVPLHRSILLVPFALCCLIVFSFGLGMLLSAMMVFFRDTQFLWGVVSMVWMYATPIFYPETIIPAELSFILKVNPLYYFIKFARTCILEGISPEPIVYIQSLAMALAMLAVGALVFKKSQDKFVLFL